MPGFLAPGQGLREAAWNRQQVTGEDSHRCRPALHSPRAGELDSKVALNYSFEHPMLPLPCGREQNW